MKGWIFAGFRSIVEASTVTDKSGQTPRIATKYISFKDSATGKIWTTTDLTYKKTIRKKALEQFKRIYIKPFSRKEISIMLIVIRESHYKSISRFLTDFKKKLARRKKSTLGYVWVRDVGDIKFEKHIHLFLAIERITGDDFRGMMAKRRATGYDVELCNNVRGFKEYLLKKELYAGSNQRCFGKSKELILPLPKKAI